ncbi:MAG: YfiR family protein [Planctomycetota bacterium]
MAAPPSPPRIPRFAARFPRALGRLRGLALALPAALASAAVAAPGPAPTPEYEVKAAFLYKFVKFTDWPAAAFPDPKAPLVVEVVGKDPFAGLLATTFAGKELHGRPFVVRHAAEVPESVDSHLLFVGDLSSRARKSLLERCRARPVLVVGEHPGLAREGAIVNLYLEEGKVRFEINPDAARAGGLQISSQLLKLARIVTPPREDGT